MLIAINQYHQTFNLMHYNKESIETLKKNMWYCPICKEELILKNGLVNIAHFAHKQHSICASFSEGETYEHLKGKMLLAQWCQAYNIPFQLEAYLPQLKQRPDLLIKGKLAIEFQCSSLPMERMIERTKNYQENGYQVLWILGRKFFLQNRLTGMKRLFLNYCENIGYYCWQLDVVKHTLRLNYFIEEIIGTKEIIYGIKEWGFQEANLVSILRYPKKTKLFVRRLHDVQKLVLEKSVVLTKGLHHKDPQLLKIQELFYMRNQHIGYLDICYFLPVNKPLFIQQDEILWKFYFWIFVEQQEKSVIKWEEIIIYFQQLILDETLTFYNIPTLNVITMIEQFLNQYIEVLKKIGYLFYTKGKIEILKKPISRPTTENHQEYLKKYLRKQTQISATPIRNVLS